MITLTQEYPTSHSACPQSHGISPSINLSPITPEMRVALDSSFGGGTQQERGKHLTRDDDGNWIKQQTGCLKDLV